MQTTGAFLRLIRIGNLLMMLATQVLAYYFLTHHLLAEDLLKPKFILLLTATFLAAASGYIINDYLDIQIDHRNKPGQVIVGHLISRRWAMFLHLSFNILAFAIGLYIHYSIAIAIISCAVVLWFYSVIFKKSYLTGNVIIALLSAFVLLILRIYDPSVSGYLVWAYAWFAFAATLLREVVKDIEDIKGDAAFGAKTLPIVSGVRQTRFFLKQWTGVIIISVFLHLFLGHSFMQYKHPHNAVLYIFYMLLFVALPLGIMIYLIHIADKKSDFGRLSAICKIIMLLGLLSMALIKL
jgi:4-hydroxybenzoate polyprenyltransferase